MLRDTPPQHRNANDEDPGSIVIVSTDLSLRHMLAAKCLQLELTAEDLRWQESRQKELIDMLFRTYGDRMMTMDAHETRKDLNHAVVNFKEEALENGNTPYIVSLDPVYLDSGLADYVFQETRVSLMDGIHGQINLEHNPRGHTNRFMYPSVTKNGAGKTRNCQIREIAADIDASEAPVAVALVEDYVNTGANLMECFSDIIGNPLVSTTVMAGLVNRSTSGHIGNKASVMSSLEISDKLNMRHMDMNDFLPTLGGRAIGISQPTPFGKMCTEPLTVTVEGQNIPLSVDAICGRYPWQADIYSDDLSADSMLELKTFCLNTALQFWKSLEESANSELTWKDLRALTGTLRFCYPTQDLSSGHKPTESPRTSPRRVIQAMIENEY